MAVKVAAYLLGIDGDPLTDIDVAINKVKWGMKAGAVATDKTKDRGH